MKITIRITRLTGVCGGYKLKRRFTLKKITNLYKFVINDFKETVLEDKDFRNFLLSMVGIQFSLGVLVGILK